MIEKTNVLIFPAGSEIGIEIFQSLKYNLHFNVMGASGKSDHAKFIYDSTNYFEDDFYINNDDFIEKFNSLLTKHNIKYVFPTHDTIALFLIENQKNIKSTILTSPFETALVARDKKMTYEIFSQEDFCPAVFQEKYDEIGYPVFLKPNRGQGGKGAFIAFSEENLRDGLKKDIDFVVCEYLPGDEISVDCFTDRHQELLFIGPRSRERVQMGISFHTKSILLTDEITQIAQKINMRLKIQGAWFFQLKKDRHGRFKLLEFAVRQASTMGLYRQIGVNFALLTLFDRMGKDVSILKNHYSIELDRCLYNRYKIEYEYDKVYLDFDDTLIVNNEINIDAMRYVYFCRNRNISVILLTKHKFDLNLTLEKYGISKSVFKEIIHLDIEGDKCAYINPVKSIFVDNYFNDRLQVYSSLGIPVFDVDAIDSLIIKS